MLTEKYVYKYMHAYLKYVGRNLFFLSTLFVSQGGANSDRVLCLSQLTFHALESVACPI